MIEPRKLLFIRRDNIGDLVCTTPAIRAARERFPGAKIGILVNSYNAEVLAGNPDVDTLHVYQKAKHTDKGRLRVWYETLGVIRTIRAEGYDVAIGCGEYSPRVEKYARMSGAPVRIGYSGDGKSGYTHAVERPEDEVHEVVKTFGLLRPLGITGEPGPMVLRADPNEAERARKFAASLRRPETPLLAVAISARIPENRWPVEKFTELIRRVSGEGLADVLVLWAPGAADDPRFPGDDARAEIIGRAGLPGVILYPTPTISALMAAVSTTDAVVTLDTGSLHISAGFARPTVALMTARKARTWYPWKTRSVVVESAGPVEEVEVDRVFEGVASVLRPSGDISEARGS